MTSARALALPAAPRATERAAEIIAALPQLFGFAQLEFAGRLAVADGRYLAREEDGRQRVLVIETLGAPAPPGRRRRKPRAAEPSEDDQPLPLTRATAVRAFEPFDSTTEAEAWLDAAVEGEQPLEDLIAEGVGLLNRSLHAQAAASVNPYVAEMTPEQAVRVRIGYGSGEDVASGRFAVARDVDVWASGASPRRRREEELHPQERVAAVLGRRERVDACETLLMRARADLDAGREREAALQLRVGLEALLVELREALLDPNHEQDMNELTSRRAEVGAAANQAVKGDLDAERSEAVRDVIAICERVLRRRSVLRG